MSEWKEIDKDVFNHEKFITLKLKENNLIIKIGDNNKAIFEFESEEKAKQQLNILKENLKNVEFW